MSGEQRATRTHSIPIRLNDAELKAVDADAKRMKLRRGELMRRRVLRKRAATGANTEPDAQLLEALSKIGNHCAEIGLSLESRLQGPLDQDQVQRIRDAQGMVETILSAVAGATRREP